MTSSQISQTVQALSDLLQVLRDDVKGAADQLNTKNDQAGRRSFVRAAFALIEGVSYGMKQWAYEAAPAEFTAGEQLILREVTYEVEHNGKLKEMPAHIRTLPNIRFAFEALARAEQVKNPFDASYKGWQDMQAAIKVRHGLTHPKTAAAMYVSDDDLKLVEDALNFYVDAIAALLKIMRTDGMRSLPAASTTPQQP